MMIWEGRQINGNPVNTTTIGIKSDRFEIAVPLKPILGGGGGDDDDDVDLEKLPYGKGFHII
jgi:hypothetical protein